MNKTEINLIPLLEYINPSQLSYQEWVNVGMALKHEGYTANIWDQWSSSDARYKPGECYIKWSSFNEETSTIVTGGTIVQMAKDAGWNPIKSGHELAWDDVISKDYTLVNPSWIEGQEVTEPAVWDPVREITTYLTLLFEASENVGYVTKSYKDAKSNRWLPTKGSYDRTAGELIELLNNCEGDISNVFGTINEEAGAWIRFNPLDGQGVKNLNVTDFRYALVESDDVNVEKQNAIYRELELPIVALVFSGKKSLHAIVRIEATNYQEYQNRVDYLYDVCQKNGLSIDTQNKNPSRLSRMPGVTRDGQKQYLVDTNIGKKSWSEWYEWIEGINDDLPDPETLSDLWNKLPPLSNPLINGILRQGHKLLLAGPSKAGKSYLLMELIVGIAEGKEWLYWKCAQGRVLYVNLELDRASCLHRFKDVYRALNWNPDHISNIDIWNLRGKSIPMDKLAPKLIRRAQKKDYIAVVIDPIYKVITGDENSADQMAHFCNQFDKVCTDLGAAVIYCHHHSKGYQGGKKSMDRASGSGVFARDPDALLDLTQLDLSKNMIKLQIDKAYCHAACEALKKYTPNYLNDVVGQDDVSSRFQMQNHLKQALNSEQLKAIQSDLDAAVCTAEHRTAWRIEGTLREFAAFDPVNVWFDYPVHHLDDSGVLKDACPEEEKPFYQRGLESRKSPEVKKEERINALEIAFAALEMDAKDQPITTTQLADELGISVKTVYRRLKEHGGFATEKPGDGSASIIKRKKNSTDKN